jgi:hypothetical protein
MCPRDPLFKSNLAYQYREQGKYGEAVSLMQEILKIDPSPVMWDNLGDLYVSQWKLNEAQKCFEKSVEIDPGHVQGHYNLGLIHHFKGDWRKGFEEFEWRLKVAPKEERYLSLYDQRHRWDGKASLEGKSIVLYGEQGLGDIIMFSRFVSELRRRHSSCHVTLHCPRALHRLLESHFDTVSDKVEKADCHGPLMSLPYLLDFPEINGGSYLNGGNSECCRKVGIAWAGNPAHPDDKWRSIPFDHFRTLKDIPGLRFFSLQFGEAKKQIEPWVVDLTAGIEDFESTRQVMTGLDLIICCDTSVAHLAGAMGKPVWVAARSLPDWRWDRYSETTRWYDSMRLFHQDRPGDWNEVFQSIKVELRNKSESLY